MKKQLYLLGLLTLPFSLQAQSTTQLEDRTITIHQNGGATVLDKIKTNVQKGSNPFMYNQFVNGLNASSIFIFSDGAPIAFNHQKAPSFDDLLKSYMNEMITVFAEDEKSYSGKLVNIKFNGIFLELKDNSVIYVKNGDVRTIHFPNLKPNYDEKESISALLSASKKEDKSMQIWYQSSVLRWKPTYKLVLNEKMTEASFQGIAQVMYSGQDKIENTTLRFNFGNLNNEVLSNEPTYRFEEVPSMRANAKMSYDAAPVTSVESIGDAYEVVLDKKVTLNPKETQNYVLTDVRKLPLKRWYEYDSYASDREKAHPITKIAFDLSKKNGFKDPIAAGDVDVMILKNNELRSLSKVSVNNTGLEEKVELNLGEVLDVQVKESVTKAEQVTPKLYNHSYKIELKNEKSESVRVKVKRGIDSNTKITESSMKYEVENAYSVVFWVEIPAGKTVSFTYSTKTEYF